MKKSFLEFAKGGFVLLDGGFGTELQKAGLPGGVAPETLNTTAPEKVLAVHRAYAAAGANVISSNTFGANRRKHPAPGEAAELTAAGVRLAREAAGEQGYVALDIGPTGALTEPLGDMSFEEAYDVFREQIEAGKGADVILIETMSDLTEAKAAALAAREHSSLPVMCSMTFDESGRTFTGCSVECFGITMSAYADFLGINCSLGPDKIFPLMRRLIAVSRVPVFVKANAGLPDSEMNYPVGAEEFAAMYAEYVDEGVSVLGGCCGTTPAHIAALKKLTAHKKPVKRDINYVSAVCSATTAVFIDGVRIIGERINPTGKKAMKEALMKGDMDYVAAQALEQTEAGAVILDVNCGLPGIDESEMLPRLVKFVGSVTDAPLQIDCGKADAVEKALRTYTGKAIVNSVNAEDSSLASLLPLVKKYGAAVVALTVGEDGVPQTVEDRLVLARKVIEAAKSYGIPEQDVFVDCLTLTAGAQQEQALNTLSALTQIKREYAVKTTLGVSNVSFGLPARKIVNTAFLTMAMYAGLDLPILNPNIAENMQAVDAFNVISGRDRGCAEYAAKYAGYKDVPAVPAGVSVPSADAAVCTPAKDAGEELFYCISKGLARAETLTRELLGTHDGLAVIDDYLIPVLGRVGDDYAAGRIFLPQLISSAETAKACFDAVRASLPDASGAEKGVIVLATVKGDVHDIGKNIVKTVLENYGYRVVDLGKNVPPEDVAEACAKHGVRLCGLSALMTTTVDNMRVTVERVHARCPGCKVMVGGAVLTADYAAEIGADRYCRDATESARYAAEVFAAD